MPDDSTANRYPRTLAWRFHASMLSIVALDLCFALIFDVPLARWLLPGVLLAIGTLLGGWMVFAPVQLYLAAPTQHRLPRRRVARLHVWCTAYMAALLALLAMLKFTLLPAILDFDIDALLSANERLALPVIHWLYYTAVVYFVMSDYEAVLRARIHERDGHIVPATRGRFVYKLLAAFVLTSLLPLSMLVLHALDHGLDTSGRTLLEDLAATALGLTVAVVFVARSFLAPLRALEQAVERVRRGDLGTDAPILASDETGRLAGGFNRMVKGLRERTLIRDTFGRYVPRRVAASILSQGGELEPASAIATILYTDIEDFTRLVDTMPAPRVVEVLNSYFSACIAPVEGNGGVVNQFQGDAMLITFNLPVGDEDHAAAALRAGREMVRLCATRSFAGVHLRTRVGIATGEVVAGNVGSDSRVNYTVHGAAVNLAARLEALCREMQADLLVDEATVNLLDEAPDLQRLGQVAIRGRRERVTVFGLPRADRTPDRAATER